ncbi:MAG TPA: substrate-binding domain-containing protein [Crenalkalicoccus sp.]|nr:substrate-binding domain-containing protein [Crenalkalicoccus sp.]
MRRVRLALLALLLLRPALAAELSVLSAGAVQPGLDRAIADFEAVSGTPVRVEYATAPQLQEKLANGATPDLLIAPVGLINELAAAGRLAGDRETLGRVGIGLVVRAGAPEPAIGDIAALKRAVEEADAVVFNRASTGQAMERLFEKLGLTAAVAPKAVRVATGAEVMQRLREGSGREIGFAAIPEIRSEPGVTLVAPLPPEAQSWTSYAATLLPGSQAEAATLLARLAGPTGRAALEAGGIEPPAR